MSVTIKIGGETAVLAGGRWRTADYLVQELLNNHLASVAIPSHLPSNDRELVAARAAVKACGGKILSMRRIPEGPSRMSDGRQIVF